jgi:hypothetical protein
MEDQQKSSVVRSIKLSAAGIRKSGESCPDCLSPLRRLSTEDVVAGEDIAWTQCFADVANGLGPGRYRCNGCLTEWGRDRNGSR